MSVDQTDYQCVTCGGAPTGCTVSGDNHKECQTSRIQCHERACVVTLSKINRF